MCDVPLVALLFSVPIPRCSEHDQRVGVHVMCIVRVYVERDAMRCLLFGIKCKAPAAYSLLVRGYIAVPSVAGHTVGFTGGVHNVRLRGLYLRRCTQQLQSAQIVGCWFCRLSKTHGQISVFGHARHVEVGVVGMWCACGVVVGMKFVRFGSAVH